MSVLLDLIQLFAPMIIFFALFIFFMVWGSRKSFATANDYLEKVRTALRGHVKGIQVIQHKREQIEIKCIPPDNVRTLSSYLSLIQRSSFPAMTANLLLRDKDKLLFAANFGSPEEKANPPFLIELIPYRKKFLIKKSFDYLIKYDDWVTPNEELNDKICMKSDNHRATRDLYTDELFISRLEELEPYFSWISLRAEEPNLEAMFEITKDAPEDIFEKSVALFFQVLAFSSSNLASKKGRTQRKKRKKRDKKE
ncbi:MAG: hypothetical protein ACTSYA_00840 [Candidatus Kariarchaeaceae archaeon]